MWWNFYSIETKGIMVKYVCHTDQEIGPIISLFNIVYLLDGCDYITRPKLMGPKTVLDFTPIWIRCSLKQRINIIRWIELFGSFPPDASDAYILQRLLQDNLGSDAKEVS